MNLQVKKLLGDGVRVSALVLQQSECFRAVLDLIGSEGDSGGEIGRQIQILARKCGGGSCGISSHGGSPARTGAGRNEVPQFNR